MDLAKVAEATTRQRLGLLAAAPGAEVRRGPGWTAIRTGLPSNDDNVVLSVGPVAEADAAELVAWLSSVPASWHAEVADERLTSTLISLGAQPERTGRWCGRALSISAAVRAVASADAAAHPPSSFKVHVADDRVDDYLDVLQACEWFDAADREAMRVALQRHPSLRHVVAVEGDRVVGAGLGFAGEALEIVNVAVPSAWRRRGGGRAVVTDLMRWGAGRGATRVVAAPSPDGAHLFSALGFRFARVTPDVCFYFTA